MTTEATKVAGETRLRPLPEDLAAIAEPVSDESPGGEDLDGDPGYIRLLEEIQPGHPTFENRSWETVRADALTLLTRTRDLHLGLILALASLRVRGIPGMTEALDVLGAWFQQEAIAKDLKPSRLIARVGLIQRLAPEPDGDGFLTEGSLPFFTLLSLQPISDAGDAQSRTLRAWREGRREPVLHALRSASSAFTESLLKDLQSLAESMAQLFRAFLQSMPREEERRVKVVTCQQRLLGEDDRLDRAGLVVTMRRLLETAKAPAGSGGGASSGSSDPAGRPGPVLAVPASPTNPLSPAGMGEALGMLESVVRYYRTHDTSSPIPFLVLRSMGLLSKDFIATVTDLLGAEWAAQVGKPLGYTAGGFSPAGIEPVAFRDIESRQEVVDTVLGVASYLEREHPSHPAALLLRRASEFIGGAFPKLVEDLSLMIPPKDLEKLTPLREGLKFFVRTS